MILYFTYWYPAEYRGRVISTLFIAQPVANALASIVSGAILGMDGVLGLKGWQWVFILEALPAIVLAVVVWFVMTDRPPSPTGSKPMSATGSTARLDEERRTIDRHHGVLSLFESLRDPRVLALSAIYFCGVTANYGIVFFMPQIVKGMGLSNLMTGFVSSVPYIIGTIGLIAWGYSSDRHHERRWHLITASLLAAAGLVVAGWLGSSFWALIGMSARDHRHLRLARGVLADAVDSSSPALRPRARSRSSTRPAISAAMSDRSWSAGSRTAPTASKPASISSPHRRSAPPSSRTSRPQRRAAGPSLRRRRTGVTMNAEDERRTLNAIA